MNAARQTRLTLVSPDAPRKLTAPALFICQFPIPDPEPVKDARQVIDRLRSLADGAALTFALGRVAFPDFEDFSAVLCHGAGRMLAVVGGPWATEAEQAGACAELRRLAL